MLPMPATTTYNDGLPYYELADDLGEAVYENDEEDDLALDDDGFPYEPEDEDDYPDDDEEDY